MMKKGAKEFLSVAAAALAVLLFTAAIVLGANAAMERFLKGELEAVMAAVEMPPADYEDEFLQLVRKLEQQEAFYQRYKTRESYHYYGQYYELYNNVYNADVWFIGTSHAAHGVNPLYIEQANPGYSFFNFALNGSNPGFYEDWWEIVLEAGYPMPKAIIWCVDWFMCDDGWLWRRIDFDTAPNMPIDIMRRMKKSQEAKKADEAETKADETEAAKEEVEEPAEKIKVTFRWWDLDQTVRELMSYLPIIASRDRIPDMVRSWFKKGESVQPAMLPEGAAEEKEVCVLPTYKHEYLRDNIGNITSDYYKGFIPWDVPFGGDASTISCHDKDIQWRAFERMLDKFEEAGIKVAFIELPEYTGVKRLKMKQNNERIAEIAARRGIPFYDYNTDDPTGIGSDVSNYSDWGHMSKKGSTVFSKFLAEEMKKILASLGV
ncbi:MAG TPA: SGNH/GDSL hydrolase family protein [Bacillota bacterium]|nr:hypothetical protein [Clostridiales bacterium]HPT84875.1 SGNH/GDSL hydrolase family protein [Bacillota bacterium]